MKMSEIVFRDPAEDERVDREVRVRHLGGMPIQKIATELGLSYGQTKNRLDRMRRFGRLN